MSVDHLQIRLNFVKSHSDLTCLLEQQKEQPSIAIQACRIVRFLEKPIVQNLD